MFNPSNFLLKIRNQFKPFILFYVWGDVIMGSKKGLALAAMERLLREYTGLRISEGAKLALKQELERYTEEISEKASRYSMHAGRRTIKEEDIKLAVKEKKY